MPRSSRLRKAVRTGVLMGVCAVAGGALFNISAVSQTPRAPARPPDATRGGASLVRQGRQIFRFDDFGDNKFWSGALQLDKAIAGSAHGGVGPGVSPKTALSVGLKVDANALPKSVLRALKAGKVDLNSPATTPGATAGPTATSTSVRSSRSPRTSSRSPTCSASTRRRSRRSSPRGGPASSTPSCSSTARASARTARRPRC